MELKDFFKNDDGNKENEKEKKDLLGDFKGNFNSGFNVLTGETGAGKTLIIDSLRNNFRR